MYRKLSPNNIYRGALGPSSFRVSQFVRVLRNATRPTSGDVNLGIRGVFIFGFSYIFEARFEFQMCPSAVVVFDRSQGLVLTAGPFLNFK